MDAFKRYDTESNNYLIEINKSELLTKEEEHDLFILMKTKDKEIKKKIAFANTRLVRSIANKYQSALAYVEYDDLI